MTTTTTVPTDSVPTTEPKPVKFTAAKALLFVESSKVDDAVLFYTNAFDAEEVKRVYHPKRKADQDVPSLVVSAEVDISDLTLVICGIAGATVKEIGTGIMFRLEAEEIEVAVEKAVKAGAVAECEWTGGTCDAAGRVGKVKDPYGIVWVITTFIGFDTSSIRNNMCPTQRGIHDLYYGDHYKHILEWGFTTAIPLCTVLLFVESSKVDDAVSFYKNAFGAEEVTRVSDEDVPSLLLSVEVDFCDCDMTAIISGITGASGKEIGTGILFRLETEEIEAAIENAVKAGAVAEGEGACDAAAGRVGKVKDPYGIVWVICTPATAAKTDGVEG